MNSVVFPLIFCLFFVIVPFLIILWAPQTGQIGLTCENILFSSKNSFWLVFSIFGLLLSLSEMIFSWSIFSSEKSKSLSWIVSYARNRHEKTMAEKLAGEIMDAVAGNGGAFKKKEDTHRMAEANKAFAHYKW